MGKFIILYKGQASDMSQMPEEAQKAVIDGWKSWMGKVGGALVDIGSPFGNGASIVDDGSEGSLVPMSGYSIVEANDLAQAKQLCEGHPFLSEGKGNFSIEVFQLLPAPF
jgi:hypothetical protein